MLKREDLGESARRGGFGKKQAYGRSAYHRHFAGYSEVLESRIGGKGMHIKRTYTGDIHQLGISTGKGAAVRAAQIALTVAAAWLFLKSATEYLPGNSFWLVNLAQAVTVAAFAWELISLVNSCRTGVYTVGAFRDGPRAFRRSSLAAAAAAATLTLVAALYALLGGQGQKIPQLFGALRYLIASVLILAVNLIERNIPYTVSPGKDEKPVDSEEIW